MQLFRVALVLMLAGIVLGCEYNLGPTINNENTNTNTNNNTFDIHDLVNFAPVPDPSAPVPAPGGGSETPLPLPAGGQAIAQGVATANATALARSCQAIFGESAWQFMDSVVAALRATDARWGYLVQTTGQVSRDVIAYRATSDNTGAWGIDIIINHCGTAPSFGWQVLGFDPAAQWSGTRF